MFTVTTLIPAGSMCRSKNFPLTKGTRSKRLVVSSAATRDASDPDKYSTPVAIPGFEKEKRSAQKATVQNKNKAAAAQDSLGYAQASKNSAFGGKVYKLGKNRQNVDEYSPIFTPQYFDDDFVTGCDNKTYAGILAVTAFASTLLPLTIIGLAFAFESSAPSGVFPFNL